MADVEDENTRGKGFKDLSLDSWVVKQCHSLGITQPTPVQFNCIPAILEGRDCIGCAKTGSGKTLAFALPILQKLWMDPYGIFALVLTPTRELAFQIAEQFQVVGKPMETQISVVVGGMNMMAQGQELARKPHVVIATPGRLLDHLESCDTFSLKKIKYLVLDEADRLLGGGYDDELQGIFQALSTKKQTLLFSATITDTLTKLKAVTMNDPFLWESKAEVATVEQLDQKYILCPPDVKDGYLVRFLQKYREKNEKGSIIIFTNSCKNCQVVSMTLSELGFENTALHSMVSQKERLAALAKFKSSVVKILISTDLASRGLDIPTVELVINHNVPLVPKEYVHRVGRTARVGRSGQAVTIVTPRDIKLLHAIEALINTKLVELKLNDQEVVKILTQVLVTRRESQIKLDAVSFEEKRNVNKRKKLILEGKDPEEEEVKRKKMAKLKRKERQKRLEAQKVEKKN